MTSTLYSLTHPHNHLTKIWKKDGSIKPSAKSKYFDYTIHKVSNIGELSQLLTNMEQESRSCLIRGRYVGDEQAESLDSEYIKGSVRRILDVFKDQAIHPIMLDVDNYKPWLSSASDDPTDCINEYIEEKLPKCFHGKTYHWQLSSSAGKSGNESILKVHVWFWLGTPRTSYELKEWAAYNKIECDAALFNPVQPHFTANPIFEDGVSDPIKQRSGLLAGKNGDEVDLNITSDTSPSQNYTRQQVKHDAALNDPIAVCLQENNFVKSLGQAGQLFIKCPFADGHSIDSTETSTVYYPAYTGGFKGGAFDCKHQSCSRRTKHDFLEKLGIAQKNVLNPANNSEIATKIIDDLYSMNGKPTLIRNREIWFVYDGKSYAEREAEGVRADVRRYLDKAYKSHEDGKTANFYPSLGHISSTIDALKSATLVENTYPPVWRDDAKKKPFDYLVMKNGILHLPDRTLIPHNPDYFCTNVLPYEYTTDKKPTKFIKFVSQIFKDDQESIDTIQEIIGYCITYDTSHQKMFMLLGPPRSGKSTLCYIIENLIGANNVANPKLNDFGQQFGMSMLENKSLAIVPDARIENGAKTKSIIETLLCITGEDTVSFDKKHKAYFTGKLNTRIILVSNVSPQLIDTSNALVSRLIFLKTQKSYLGKEDTTLKNTLISELPQIFGWALDGRDRLLKRGKFLQPEASAHLLEEFKIISNPIQRFVNEKCVIGKGYKVLKDDLLYHYNIWSDEAGGRNYGHKEQFSSDLISCVIGVSTTRSSDEGGRRYFYSGIDLKENFDDPADQAD